jgi:CBS domain-containing protein
MSEPAVACSEEAPIDYVVDLLADREISGLPVVDRRGRVVGVLSERDVADALGGSLLRLALHHAADTGPFLRTPRNGLKRVARDIMTTPAIIAAPDTNIGDLAAMMIDHAVNRIPIVADGRLVGIVTRADILRLLRA